MADAPNTPSQVQPLTASAILDAPDPAVKPLPGQPAAGASKTPIPETDPASPKLQLLMQREKQALERERAAKAAEVSAQNTGKTLAEREARLAAFESVKTKDRKKALELLGISYEELTQSLMADGTITPDEKIKKLEERINADAETRAQERAAQTEAQREAQNQRLNERNSQFISEVNDYLKENSSRYELIAFEAKEQLVYDVIAEHCERTLKAAQKKLEEEGGDVSTAVGEIMTIATAADKVEGHLEKKYHEKAPKLNKLVTFMARRPSPEQKPNPNPSQKLPTLTNQMSATPERKTARLLTDEERLQKAIAYARGLRPNA